MVESSAEFSQYLSQQYLREKSGSKVLQASRLWEFARSGRAALKITPAVHLGVNHRCFSSEITGYLGIAIIWGHNDRKLLSIMGSSLGCFTKTRFSKNK